ncbi:ribonuclease D [Halieaceae bacterium IMCC14734]|uniref:Ribonuclease D n=1 Tax=Candidatus Litorirhabdus singularis TaxID=2518993 RepID=A0ABT3TGK9_9GAMM|nr:ribonuclease D [Candidatus Litorirhabdus singularis]MCX2981447.1 ribonuclease D [Candidatus Litorirhabdus singularis]
MSWQLVTENEVFAEILAAHSDAKAVVIDTEFMRTDTFYAKAALIQLCFVGSEEAWLIDPLTVSDLSPLAELLENPHITKILHSPSEDLEVFQHLLGCLPRPLFDSQRAAACLGLGFGLGYRGLIEQLTGAQIPKEETRSNWLRRPLSDAQLEYAAQDVLPLARLYPRLHQELLDGGRLEWVLEDSESAVQVALAPAAPPHLRIKSAWKLKPVQLARLAALCAWREERAVVVDKPRNWILHDKSCLALAERGARSEADLATIPDMPASVVRKQGATLLTVLQQAEASGDTVPPLPEPLSAQQRNTVKAMKKKVAGIAQEWQVAPEILLTGKDYELLVRLAEPGAVIAEPVTWAGWRRQPLIEPLLEIANAAR